MLFRSHDFMLWLLPMTFKLPRSQRFVLAHQLQQLGFQLQEHLMRASRAPSAAASLRLADVCIMQLRANLRLAHELTLISTGQYENGSRLCFELGRLLGAWLKHADAPAARR